MPELNPIKRLNYIGGISRLPLQGEGQVKRLQNARPLRSGGIQVRGGQVLHSSIGADPTVGSITDIFAYRTKALGTRLYSLRRTTDGDKLFDNTTEVTGPALTGADYSSIVEGKGTIFLSNGLSDDIQYHVPDTTVRAAITNSYSGESLPQGNFLKTYRNRLYVWTDTGLRYSNTGIYTTLPAVHFPDANLIQVREENAEARGLAVGDNILVMFTPDSYSIMTGTPGNEGGRGTYSLQEYQGVGCSTPRSITTKGNRIAWIDAEKRIKLLEGPILRDLDSKDFVAEYLQTANYPTATSAKFLGTELWLFLPKANAPNERRVLVYDLYLDSWIAEFTNIEGYAIDYLPEINAVFVGSHTGGYIWQQAHGAFNPRDDSGTLIPFEMVDGQMLFGSLWHKKIYEKILVSYKINWTESLAFSYATNEIDSYTSFELNASKTAATHNWGDDNWGVQPWGTAGLETVTLRAKEDYGILASSLRLKIAGDVSAGTIIYGTETHASSVYRDGESDIA